MQRSPVKASFQKRNFGQTSIFFNQYKEKTRQVLSNKPGVLNERSKSEKRKEEEPAAAIDHTPNVTAYF